VQHLLCSIHSTTPDSKAKDCGKRKSPGLLCGAVGVVGRYTYRHEYIGSKVIFRGFCGVLD
jgi:hypothetical protein